MEYKTHKVEAEEKLSEIAKKYNLSITEIKKSNPDVRFFKNFWGEDYVAFMQTLKIPILTPITKNNLLLLRSLFFQKKARYRCNQINVTKALNSVTFSADIKTQYLLSIAKYKNPCFHILLEDYIHHITPQELDASFELIKPVELLKNDIKFIQQDKEAQISNILNFSLIEKKWEKFKDEVLPNIDFYKELRKQSKESAEDFINSGNTEFSNESKFKEVLDKNLFYHVLLKANVGDNLEDYSFTQKSQLFPDQELKINVVKTKISENENTAMFKLTGELDRENISEQKLEEQYNEIYKPLLKYSYTEFDYIYRITYTIDTKTGFLIEGRVSLSEKIKNNFESITQFEIKQVEL